MSLDPITVQVQSEAVVAEDPTHVTRKIMRTIAFKLHNPSKHKQRVLDLTLKAYTDAVRELLESAKERYTELMAQSAFTDTKGRPRFHIRALMSALHDLPCPSSATLSSVLRDGLYSEVAASLISYNRRQASDPNTSFPEGRPTVVPDHLTPLLDRLYIDPLGDNTQGNPWLIETVEEYREFHDQFTRRGRYKPLSPLFTRARDFSLMQFDTERHANRWGVRLPLLARGNETGKTSFYFPLAFGEWHEQWLEKGVPKVARLVPRRGEYYLYVVFELQVQVLKEPETFLGLAQSVDPLGAYAIVDRQGRVLESGLGPSLAALDASIGSAVRRLQKQDRAVDQKHWKQGAIKDALHIWAKQLLNKAQESRSQIVYADVKGIAGKAAEKPKSAAKGPQFRKSHIRELAIILDHNSLMVGLPEPRPIFGAGSFKICSVCGEFGSIVPDPERAEAASNSKRKQPLPKIHFTCNCGNSMNKHLNAAINLARRPLYRKADWESRGGYRGFHRSFAKPAPEPEKPSSTDSRI